MRAALGATAIALGVALFVSSHVAVSSVAGALERTRAELAGEARWQVTGGGTGGVDEALLLTLRRIPGAVAVPVIQASTHLDEPFDETLLVLGVDLWSDQLLRLYRIEGRPQGPLAVTLTADGVLVTRRFAERHGLAAGAPLPLATPQGRRSLKVAGLLEDEGPARVFGGAFAVVGLATAQRLFGQPGRVDRFEVAGVGREELERAVSGYRVLPIGHSGAVAEDALLMIRSLGAVSLVALLLAAFILYNVVSVSVTERLKEVGILRALGAGRGQVLSAFLSEWALVGLTGSLAGIALGYLLARQLVGLTSETVNAVVRVAEVQDVVLTPGGVALALALGLGATLTGAWGPVRGALRSPPPVLLAPYLQRARTRFRGALLAGGVLLAAAAALLAAPSRWVWPGMASWGLGFVGSALALPALALALARGSRKAARRTRIEALLAMQNAARFPRRTALTVVALGGSLALMISTAALVAGFEQVTVRWIEEAFPYDLAVAANDVTRSLFSEEAFPSDLEGDVRGAPGVETTYAVRSRRLSLEGATEAEVLLLAVETEAFRRMHHRRPASAWLREIEKDRAFEDLAAGRGVLISRNLARLQDLEVGDRLALPTPAGRRNLPVLGTVEDYSWSLGSVWLDLGTYRELWDDDSLSYLCLRLNGGAEPSAVRRHLEAKLAHRGSLFVYRRQDVEATARDTLGQTIALARIQVVVAGGIGLLGIANSLLISVLLRRREIGLLRAVGMTRRQAAVVALLEASLLGLVGGVFGVAVGLLGGWLPLRRYVLAFTGFLPPAIFPLFEVLLALGASLLIGLAAGVEPARRSAGVNVLEAIGYE